MHNVTFLQTLYSAITYPKYIANILQYLGIYHNTKIAGNTQPWMLTCFKVLDCHYQGGLVQT